MSLSIVHLLLASHLLLGSNCHVEDLDYSKVDRFYVGVAMVPGFFPNRSHCSADDKAHVDVFATPSMSRKTAEIRWGLVGDPGRGYCTPLVFEQGASCPRGRLQYTLYSDEDMGFTVVERDGLWVRIRLDHGTGWIRLSEGDRVDDYEDLVADQAEMTKAWDGHLSSRPNGSWRVIAPIEHQYVTVIDSRRVHGRLWFKVRLLAESPHEVKDPRVLATGWVRAYSDKRQPTVFPDRGC
jgi:hypothetical protein